MTKSFFSLIFLVLLCNCVAESVADLYVMSYFRGNGQAGIFVAAGEDGLTFKPLNNDQPVMKPASWEEQNLTRDPSIVWHDGKFCAVWTTSWKGNCFGYAESPDLINWSEPVRVEPFQHGENPRNCWAPEICWDPMQKNFMIVWSSVLEGTKESKMFSTRTTDGKTFTPANLYFDHDPHCIDGFTALDTTAPESRWVMVYKDERPVRGGGKNLRVATIGPDFQKPWNVQPTPIVGAGTEISGDSMAEGPSLLRTEKGWNLYWDAPQVKRYGLAVSTDLKTWNDRSSELHLPKDVRHGTIFRAPRAAVGWLNKANPVASSVQLP